MIKKLQAIPTGFYVASSAWIGRFVVAGIQLVSIPLLLKILGTEQYSWLVVAMSLQAWWILTDIGLSISLQNAISARRARQESDEDLIVSVAIMVLPIVFAYCIGLMLFSRPLALWLLPSAASKGGEGAMLVSVTGIFGLLLACGNVAYRIFYARHQGYWVNILPAIGSFLSLCGLLALQRFPVAHTLLWASLIWAGPTGLLTSIAFAFLTAAAFKRAKKALQKDVCKTLLRKGLQFGLFTLFAAFTLQIDYIVIGKLMSEQDILLYNIATKILTFVSFFFTAVVQAMWPVSSEAAALRDWAKVDSIMTRMLGVGTLMILLGSTGMWLVRAQIVRFLVPSQPLIIPLALWGLLTLGALIRAWADTFAMLLQSMNQVKVFLVYIPIQSALCVFGQIYLGKHFGLKGIVGASILSFLLTASWILPWRYRVMKSARLSGVHEAA